MLEFFMQIEELKEKAIDLLAKVNEAEEEKKELFRALILKEAECEKLKKERDRLSNLCRIKDRIIKEGEGGKCYRV